MTALEDELRATLARRSASPPAHADIADSVIGRVAAVKRRRRAGSAFATVLIMVMGLAGVAVLRGLANPQGISAHGINRVDPVNEERDLMAYDWVYDHELNTVAGPSFDLGGSPQSIRRVGAGWVYLAANDELMFLSRNGVPKDLGSSGTHMVVSGDGTTIAVFDGAKNLLSLTRIDKLTGQFIAGNSIRLSEGVVLIAAFEETVVIQRNTAGGAPEFGLWSLRSPRLTDKWLTGVDQVYGWVSTSTLLGAGWRDGKQCLVTLLVKGDVLQPSRYSCDRKLNYGVAGSLSPDGRLLILGQWTSSIPGEVMLINLTKGDWSAADICKATTTPPVWLSTGLAAIQTAEGYAACATDRVRAVARPDGLPRGASIMLVPVSA